MAKSEEVTLRVFLMGDGVTVAMARQKTPDGYYKLDRMLSAVPTSRRSGRLLRHLHGRTGHHWTRSPMDPVRDYFYSGLPAQSIRSAAECPCRVRTPVAHLDPILRWTRICP